MACCNRMKPVASPTRPPASWPFRMMPSAANGPASRLSHSNASNSTCTPTTRMAFTASAAPRAGAAGTTTKASPRPAQRPTKSVAAPMSAKATPQPPSVSRASASRPPASPPSSRFSTPACPARVAAIARPGSGRPAGVNTRTLNASRMIAPNFALPADFALSPYLHRPETNRAASSPCQISRDRPGRLPSTKGTSCTLGCITGPWPK